MNSKASISLHFGFSRTTAWTSCCRRHAIYLLKPAQKLLTTAFVSTQKWFSKQSRHARASLSCTRETLTTRSISAATGWRLVRLQAHQTSWNSMEHAMQAIVRTSRICSNWFRCLTSCTSPLATQLSLSIYMHPSVISNVRTTCSP